MIAFEHDKKAQSNPSKNSRSHQNVHLFTRSSNAPTVELGSIIKEMVAATYAVKAINLAIRLARSIVFEKMH